MLGADIFDRLRQLRLAGLDAEVNFGLSHQLTGFFLEQRHFDFPAFFPVLVETIQIIRQPSRADFQEGDAQFGKTQRYALADHAGKLQQDAGSKGVGVNLGEGI